jgi:hypothetical protein
VSAANPGKAVAAYLTAKLEGETSGTVKEGLRVFYPRLPTSEQANMPERAVVVSRAGGSQMLSQTFLPIVDAILDVTCYGSTLFEADTLADEAMLALQNLRQSRWEGVVLKWARIAAAPIAEIDNHTNWPESLVVVQVMHNREGS